MFRKERVPEFDPEKYVGHALLSLPRCTSRVVAIDTTLDETFDCTFIVRAEELLCWLQDHFSKVHACGERAEAAQSAFLIWLQASERVDSGSILRVPQELFEFYSDYASELVNSAFGFVHCRQCNVNYPKVSVAYEGSKQGGGGWHSGTEVWRCPELHVLRHHGYNFQLLTS